MASTKPDIFVDVNEHNMITIKEVVTIVKTYNMSFYLDQEYTCDPGYGTNLKYVTTLEGGDTHVMKELDEPSSTMDEGLVVSVTKKGVTSIRSFVRA
jgi:hypothetical protein